MITDFEEPIRYDDVSDIARFNELLDAVSEKLFIAPGHFVQAVRAACNLEGISLPLLDIEGQNGPSPDMGKDALIYGITQVVTPLEGEYVFNIEDPQGSVQDIYLYITVNMTENGLFDCYAQIVDDEHLHDLLNMAPEDYTPDIHNNYLEKVRRASGTNIATNTDMDDGPPLD